MGVGPASRHGERECFLVQGLTEIGLKEAHCPYVTVSCTFAFKTDEQQEVVKHSLFALWSTRDHLKRTFPFQGCHSRLLSSTSKLFAINKAAV